MLMADDNNKLPVPLDPGRYEREGLMHLGLTHKQEMFVQEWYRTGSKSAAYTKIYNPKNAKRAKEEGWKLSNKPEIRMRYQQLLHYVSEVTGTTGIVVDRMYKDAYEVARAEGQASAMVSAANGLAKLHGLNAPDKLAVINHNAEKFESRYMKKLFNAVEGIEDRTPVLIDEAVIEPSDI